MSKYDDASWHYGGEYPENLPDENAAIHIGMFITWCIDNDLLSEEQKEDNHEDLQKVKNRKMTGGEFLINNCDEKFSASDLCELGNGFAGDYYNDGTKFTEKHGCYGNDFSELFAEHETVYHVEDTWENYEKIKPIVDKRFEEWKKYKENLE
ncbi:MAG: hypothetical protein FWG66_06300 [Spirochaetes bacterium]|nr:hypothetical protein [Spirochaetota bacterium]